MKREVDTDTDALRDILNDIADLLAIVCDAPNELTDVQRADIAQAAEVVSGVFDEVV